MSVKLNTPGSTHAASLVKSGKIKDSGSWKPPAAEAENTFIEEHGVAAFGTWHLGMDTGADEGTKGRFKFIFTSDFEQIDFAGLRACINRAAQAGYGDIQRRAQALYDQAKKKLGKEKAYAGFTVRCDAADGDPDGDGDENAEGVIDIFDEIGGWGVRTVDFAAALKDLGPDRPVRVNINSPGGDVFAGIAIYSLLQQRNGEVSTCVLGLAASAASVVAMAGRTHMARGSLMLIHNPTWGTLGDEHDMEWARDWLQKIGDQLAGIYARKTGNTAEKMKTLMDRQEGFTADEALALGLCDEITEDVAITNHIKRLNISAAAWSPPRAASPPPPPRASGTQSGTRKQSMKKLLNALVEAKLIPSANLEEDEIVDVLKAELKRRDDAAGADKTKVQDLQKQIDEGRKKQAEAVIAQAVKDGKITDDAKLKERWVKAYLADTEGTLDMLNAMTGPKAPAAPPKGGPPLPEGPALDQLPTDPKDLIAVFNKMPEGPEKTEFQRKHANQLLNAFRTQKPKAPAAAN